MIPELSIIVPVYNEEKRIIKGVIEILRFCRQYIKKWEIIIVNDGSIDKTEQILRDININGDIKIISYIKNQGKGGAISTGIDVAQYEYILFTDIDLSTPIREVQKLFQYIRNYDIVIGSRNMPTSIVEKQGGLRRIAGQIFPLLVKYIIKLNIKDTQCGFKLFKGSTKYLFNNMYVKGWAFDVEILVKAKNLRYKIKEVGVEWKNDKGSRLHILKDSYKMFKELLKIKKWYNIR